MNKSDRLIYATDKDIFDLLESSKMKITENVLRDVARKRGIYFSPKDSREDLVESVSRLPFTFNELIDLIERRESPRRQEKTTLVVFDADIPIDVLKEALTEYRTEVGVSEKVNFHNNGTDGLIVDVEYEDMDYSRTRLIQRQVMDSHIEIQRVDGKVEVRLPASDKSKNIVKRLKDSVERRQLAPIEQHVIELEAGYSADERSAFFTKLISSIPGYELKGVTNLKIAPSVRPADDQDELDLEDEEELAKQEMLTIVKSMALNGENLINSAEYQSLKKRGFYLTSITWKAQSKSIPYDEPVLHAEFENGEDCSGFKYLVRGAHRYQQGILTKTTRPVTESERKALYSLIENTARKVLIELSIERQAIESKSQEQS